VGPRWPGDPRSIPHHPGGPTLGSRSEREPGSRAPLSRDIPWKIGTLPVEALAADDAHLWLWVANGTLCAPVQEHSHKPEEQFSIIERCSPGPYLELFARRKQPGWDAWGNQVDRDVTMPLSHS
jgi:N6-adenosine-specific RNA methylase IME4